MYIGDIAEDQILDFYFGTTDTFTGPALAVYKGNSLTEEAVAGITLDVDFDGITGLNHVRIDTSASAFYAVANDYAVVITAGTVLGQSQVGTVLREFSIENRSAALASVATEARLAELDAANLPADVETIVAAAVAILNDTAELQTDWADGGRLDLLLDAIPTTPMRGTDGAALASVATELRLAELDAGNLPADVAAIPTTAMRGTDNAALATVATEARLAELDAANLPTDIGRVETDTQDIQSRLPTALVGGRIDATVDGVGLEAAAIDALLQRQITESYNADGAAPTVEQALMGILQALTEFSISGTTITVKRLDGSTTAMTFTLDDGTNPTSRTRAT